MEIFFLLSCVVAKGFTQNSFLALFSMLVKLPRVKCKVPSLPSNKSNKKLLRFLPDLTSHGNEVNECLSASPHKLLLGGHNNPIRWVCKSKKIGKHESCSSSCQVINCRP